MLGTYWFYIIKKRKILMDAFRIMTNNPFKENFMGKEKKNAINVLTILLLFFFHKSGVKTFIK